MPSLFERLFTHLAWADDRALAALAAMPVPDPGALKLMAHVLGSERVWIQRIQHGDSPAPIWPELDMSGCAALAAEVHDACRSFVATLDDTGRSRVVHYHNSMGNAFETKVEDILLHVALHGAYHRGQIAAAIRAAGGAPEVTDYIAVTRLAPVSLPSASADHQSQPESLETEVLQAARNDIVDQICRAVRERRLIRFMYDGGARIVEPHLIGINQQGHTSLSAWFLRGVSASNEGPGWRLYLVDKMHHVSTLDERFSGPRPEYNPDDTRMKWAILCRL